LPALDAENRTPGLFPETKRPVPDEREENMKDSITRAGTTRRYNDDP
jgi:hypothetical protein